MGVDRLNARSPQRGANCVTHLYQIVHHLLGKAFCGLTVDDENTVVTQIQRIFTFVGQPLQRRALPEGFGDFVQVLGHIAFPHIATDTTGNTFPDTLAGKQDDAHRRFARQLLAQHVIEGGDHLFVRTRQWRGFQNKPGAPLIDEQLIHIVIVAIRQGSHQGGITPGLLQIGTGRCGSVLPFPAVDQPHQVV